MPDVWTTNPAMLRLYLRESGSRCGVPGRVLPGRNPEWTCTFDSNGIVRDVYIHDIKELYFAPPVSGVLIVLSALGIIIGLVWGRWFWRGRGV